MSKQQKVAGNVVICENEEPIAAEMDQIQNRIRERAFEISLSRNHAGREVDDWLSAEAELVLSPPAEIAEKDGAFIIRMSAPGVDATSMTIMAARNQILVKSPFREEHEPDSRIHFSDFKSAILFRILELPQSIELGSVKAELNDGFLRITAQREGFSQPPQPEVKVRPARKTAAKTRKTKT